ncbi:hypothetical protein OC842_007567 [Tilletia horrida]|uniref:CHY-type domain-containing protein n=1 Tax=Tilletia horrida TaxID=155126 RepID=A0AAN6JMA7_9BASI|nr:hypothetical protein OC842_007567 [Tilletia horrida]
MCKHILNAQVSVRAPCCHRWFDCPQCHAEQSDHPLRRTMEVTMICKKCKKAFRKDMTDFEEGSDDRCPACDNLYVLTAKTPNAIPRPPPSQEDEDEEDDDRLDNRLAAHLDDRLVSRRTLVSAARRERDQAIAERIDEGGWAEALRSAREGEGGRSLFLGASWDRDDEGEGLGVGARAGKTAVTASAAAAAAGGRGQGMTSFDDDDLDWS